MYLSPFIYASDYQKNAKHAKLKTTVQLLSASNFKVFVTLQHNNILYIIDMDGCCFAKLEK